MDVEELAEQIADAWKRETVKAPYRKIAEASDSLWAAISACQQARKWADADKIAAAWRLFLDEQLPSMVPDVRYYAIGRLENSCGYLNNIHAMYEYHLNGDYGYASVLFEKAQDQHDRAAANFEKIQLAADAPTEAVEEHKQQIASARAEALRGRGMKLLTRGELALQSWDLARAEETLQASLTDLKGAEALEFGTKGQDLSGLASPQPNFIDYAQAMLLEVKSDQAMLAQDLTNAAKHQGERAQALERCMAMHAKAGTDMNEAFARRLSRDARAAEQRQTTFEAAADRQSRYAWLLPPLFYVMALVLPAIVLLLEPSWANNKLVIASMFPYALVIAGIGSGLIKWSEGANWFKTIIGAADAGKQ